MNERRLYAAANKLTGAGDLTTESVLRCGDRRRCRLLSTFAGKNGQRMHVAPPFKVSPAKAADLDLPEKMPGRAWIAEGPLTVLVGCDHELREVTVE